MKKIAILLLSVASGSVSSQELPNFNRDDFGQVVLKHRQAGSAEFQFELAIGDYNNEPIHQYSDQSAFSQIGRSVGRLDILTDVNTFPCTAFIVSEQYIVTNNHCVPGIIENPQSGATEIHAIQFVAGYTKEGVEDDANRYQVNPIPVETSVDLDYSILRIYGNPAKEWGELRLASHAPRAKDPFWIIGHPMGEAQRISREKCRAGDPAISSGRLRHTCDTLPGNSGSPVIDASQQTVVALHNAGNSRNSLNYAIPMLMIIEKSAILSALVKKSDETERDRMQAATAAHLDDINELKRLRAEREASERKLASEIARKAELEDEAEEIADELARTQLELIEVQKQVPNPDGIEGLFRPVEGNAWTCAQQDVGMDHGALEISKTRFEGVENSCRIEKRTTHSNGSVELGLSCFAEGAEYQDHITVTPTPTGVSLKRDGYTVEWEHCRTSRQAPVMTPQPANRWGWDGQAASIVQAGIALSLSCEVFNASGMYTVANIAGYCPMCMYGDEVDFDFVIYAGYTETFLFEKKAMPKGGPVT